MTDHTPLSAEELQDLQARAAECEAAQLPGELLRRLLFTLERAKLESRLDGERVKRWMSAVEEGQRIHTARGRVIYAQAALLKLWEPPVGTVVPGMGPLLADIETWWKEANL